MLITPSGIRIAWKPMNNLPDSCAAVLEAADGTVYAEIARRQPRGPRSWTWYLPPSAPRKGHRGPQSGYAESKAAARRACEDALFTA